MTLCTTLLCLACLAAAAPEGRANEPAGLRVGTAAVDISPDVVPFQLRSGPSSHVHDPFHVRAVAFENGDGRAAIALVDDIGVGREWTDEAKAEAARQTGWDAGQMLVCATHTHTAPKGGDTSPGRIAYEKRRREGLTAALVGAIGTLQPAQVGFASDAEPSEVYNRRWYLKPEADHGNPFGGLDQVRTNPPRPDLLRPAGPVDPEVAVIDVRTRRGRPLAVISNYALHYVGGVPQATRPDGREEGMASADYFGEFARIMPHRLGGTNPPEGFVALLTNGASGDINNIDFHGTRPPRAPFEQIRLVAAKVADAAWRAVKKIERYDADPAIAVRQREVALNYRVPTPAEVENARRLLALPRQEREAVHPRADGYARTVVRMADPEHPRTEAVLIQAVRIGDQAIVALPFETFVETGLELKEKSPFPRTLVIGLANGSEGYLPTPEQHKLGGYETWLGTSKFEEDASEILTRELLAMLTELRTAESASETE
ncbi:hypothetical protein [Alienimonas californiensis]|uniref:Neutral/alkaline non-lysosomal ceramidase n=1 Tax=Alienimonas californiensis TaxID=2527989 RepID=A0A517P698_9PLAN|nr:hypothetical protein [Alienimonas californiensis]QDT14887.1 hypothetical protein CA12_09670 [Alienimonas californiensis]